MRTREPAIAARFTTVTLTRTGSSTRAASEVYRRILQACR